MPSHKLVLKSVSPQSDLKAVVHLVSEIKGSSINQSIDWIKHLPLTLSSNSSEEKSLEIITTLKGLGAHVECSPPILQKKQPQPRPNIKKQRVSKKDIQSTWSISAGIIIALGVIALAIFIPTINWIYSTTRPADEKSLRAAHEGSKLIGQKQFTKASTLLRKSIKDNPYNTAPYIAEAINLISKARSKMDSTQWSGYGVSKKRKSNDLGGYGNLPKTGIDRLPLPEATKAIHILKKALQLEPKNPEIFRWLGYIYQQKGLYNKAESNIKKAITLTPNNVLYKNLLGKLYLENQHYSKADYVFRQALELDTNNIHTLKNLGLLNQFYLNDTSLAQHYYFKYMQKNPSQQNDFDVNIIKKELMQIVWKKYNSNYFLNGSTRSFSKYEAKRKQLQLELKQSRSAKKTEELALLFAKNGKINEAKDYFQKALIIDPGLTSSYNYLALLHASKNELTVTRMMLNRALAKGSKDPFVFKNLALFEKYYNNNPTLSMKYLKRYLDYGGDTHKRDLKSEFRN